MSHRRLLALTLAGAATLAGCGTGGAETSGSLQVLASFYPLKYVVEQVGGDLVEVTSLTAPGAEPHDLELSPRQLRAVSETDVVVYLSGFQPAVDEAVAERRPAHLLDAADAADLQPLPDGDGQGDGENGGLDPHFWLDPTRLAAVAQQVAGVMGDADPGNAVTFRSRADTLETDLRALDGEFRTGLADCQRDVIVTSHAAFGYLTGRYGLRQVGVAGLDPQGEPSPARMRQVRDVVGQYGVTTVFTEPMADPAVAGTLAADLGVDLAVLDPVENQTDPASDYRDVMRSDLAALRAALGCA